MLSTPTRSSSVFPRMLADARAGDVEVLGRLWMEFRNYLLLVANRNLDVDLRAKVSPSDLVQQTFLEAQRDFAQFHGNREEELLAWLDRILANNIANESRRYRGTDMRPWAARSLWPALGRSGPAPGTWPMTLQRPATGSLLARSWRHWSGLWADCRSTTARSSACDTTGSSRLPPSARRWVVPPRLPANFGPEPWTIWKRS